MQRGSRTGQQGSSSGQSNGGNGRGAQTRAQLQPQQQPQPQPQQPPAGLRIGNYIATGVLGSGSFSTVYRAVLDPACDAAAAPAAAPSLQPALQPLAPALPLPREVAIKAIPLTRLDDRVRRALEAEIRLQLRISHPHCVRLLDVRRSARFCYLFLELATSDLALWLRQHGPLTALQARGVMRQLASGLRHLYSLRILHRDIKPSNICLVWPPAPNTISSGSSSSSSNRRSIEGATVKLCDFGFARTLAGTGMADTLCGSPLYMAPEMLRLQRYDARAECWSIGIVLLQLLTGKAPFTAKSPFQLLATIEANSWTAGPASQHMPPPDALDTCGGLLPASVAADAPPLLLDLLRRLLRRNPEHRMTLEELFLHPWIGVGAVSVAPESNNSATAAVPAPTQPPPPPPVPPPVPVLDAFGFPPDQLSLDIFGYPPAPTPAPAATPSGSRLKPQPQQQQAMAMVMAMSSGGSCSCSWAHVHTDSNKEQAGDGSSDAGPLSGSFIMVDEDALMRASFPNATTATTAAAAAAAGGAGAAAPATALTLQPLSQRLLGHWSEGRKQEAQQGGVGAAPLQPFCLERTLAAVASTLR